MNTRNTFRLVAMAGLLGLGSLFIGGAAAPSPQLTFHTFIISEIFTSVDGQVQFIELKENSNFNGQQNLSGHTITAENTDGSVVNTFTFPSNLPSSQTAGKRVLIATANFAALPGGVTPNYVIPPNFLFTGGRVNFAELSAGANVLYTNLPTNGSSSFNFPGTATAANSPQNFAAATGSVNVPSGSCCVGSVCSVTSSVGCAGTFTTAGTCSPNPCTPSVTGACCAATACSIDTQTNCVGAGRVYRGDGVSCGEVGNPTACCAANFNQSGGVSVQDIFDFLGAYFEGDPSANFNNSGGITVQDIFDFLSAYFAGC